MTIQWFPGHMHSARKQVAETMARVDFVIEVLDARAPWSSSNPLIETLRKARQRPVLRILNKADLADPKVSQLWKTFYHQQDSSTLLLGFENKKGAGALILKLARKLVPHRNSSEKPLRAMILGIPNAGKSTLLNCLAKRRIAAVADIPGVTKAQQRVETPEGMILYDTPGLMSPKLEYPACGYRLALCGSIGQNAYNEIDIALFALDTLCQRYPVMLHTRYGLDPLEPTEAVFGLIARRHGALQSGGSIDQQKAASIILSDFREGQLGRISLECPVDIPTSV